MATHAGTPGGTHIVWGRPESVDASGDLSSANDSWSSAIKGVQFQDESSSSLQQEFSESWGPLGAAGAGNRTRTPQACGDEGLTINSDGEAEEDCRESSVGPEGSCYDYELHNSGRCKPCNFFAKKVGCTGGDSCAFCHLPHAEQKRARPSKVKRDRCKVIAETTTPTPYIREPVAAAVPGERLKEMAERESLQGSYMRSILASRARKESTCGTASGSVAG